MSSVSVICLRRDIEDLLEALNSFGEFHIENAVEASELLDNSQKNQKIEAVIANINDLIRVLKVENQGLAGMFRKEKVATTQFAAESWQTLFDMVAEEVSNLNRQTQDLSASIKSLALRKAELNHVKEMLTIMEAMEVDLSTMKTLRSISIVVASVPTKNLTDLDKALKGLPLIFHRCYLAKDTQFACSAFASKHRQDIERILKTHHGEIFEVPPELPLDVSEALKEVKRQLEENARSAKEVEHSLSEISKANADKLASLKETSQNILALLKAEQKIMLLGRTAIVAGFVPKRRVRQLRDKVISQLGGSVLVLENEVKPYADPPTMIRNSRFVKPFEEITRLYGVPHYLEIDPTPIIAVTFPLIFGLMFGDVGHGLVLLVGGLTLGFLIKKQSGIKNVAWIMAACGIGAIFAGLLFGEFFGTQLFAPLWFSPFDNVLTFLIFSLFVGVAQIVSGIVIEMINYLLKRNLLDALLTSLPKIVFYIGSVLLIATYKLDFSVWLSGPILLALVPFLVLVFGRTIAVRVASFSWSSVEIPQERKSLGERFFESSDLVARLMSNTMSYTRILALLMAHWALILVTYVIASLVGTSTPISLIISGFIIIIGNVFVVALEGLIVFIHSLRLHFYEWFSKFYGGNGTPFSPFKQKFIYTELKLGTKEGKSSP